MNDNPLFSVIIPHKNRKKCLYDVWFKDSTNKVIKYISHLMKYSKNSCTFAECLEII